MTVSTEVDHNDYTGNGVTTSFPYTFRIFKKSDLVVQVVDLNENITELILDTDYTVTGAGGYSGGNVILMTALTNGYQISISRELPVTQETDLRNQGKFFAEVHEDAFDKLTMLIQQVRSWLSLALRKPSFVANYYDALNNYIRNLRDPSRPQDAATKNYVDSVATTNLSHTLRTPEAIPALPGIEQRKNKIVAMDDSGNPIMVLPESGSASDVMIELAKSDGESLIGGTTYSGIRAFSGSGNQIKCLGRDNIFDGGQGCFLLDNIDITSPDNGGTILIDSAGRRWKRQFSGAIDVRWFGLKCDGVSDDGPALNGIIAAIGSGNTYGEDYRSTTIKFPQSSTVLINTKVLVASNVIFSGFGVTIESTMSDYIFESGYYSSGLLVSNWDLSDEDAVSSRIVGLRFSGFTFNYVKYAFKLRAINELSGFDNIRFYKCGSAIKGIQNFYSHIRDVVIRDDHPDLIGAQAIDIGNAYNDVDITNVVISTRNKGYLIGVDGGVEKSSYNLRISGGSIENVTYGIELRGKLRTLSIDGLYIENVINGIYDTDGDIKHSISINSPFTYNVTMLVDLGGLRDGYIDAVVDAQDESKSKVNVRADGYDSYTTVALNGNNGIINNSRFSISPNCKVVGNFSTQGIEGSDYVATDSYGLGFSLDNSSVLRTVKSYGWNGFASGVIVGGALHNTSGTEVYINTNFKYSPYTPILYSIKITPDSGSGTGGTTPSPIVFSGIIIGTKVMKNEYLGNDYISQDSSGNVILHLAGFGSSSSDSSYQWMRDGKFKSEGIMQIP